MKPQIDKETIKNATEALIKAILNKANHASTTVGDLTGAIYALRELEKDSE